MTGFNLSDWAIRHRPLISFFMIVIVVAGVFSYLRLGRSEDPVFSIKTMVVQTSWRGASIGDTLLQITDRIEKKLQETPYLDHIRSYTVAGQTTGPCARRDAGHRGAKKPAPRGRRKRFPT